MRITTSLTGDKELKRKLENMARETPKVAAKALRVVGTEKIFNPSQVECPVKTGKLKATGRIRVSTAESRGVSIKVTYGDRDAWYAVIVHEKQKKFLEGPVMQAKPTLAADVAKEIDLKRMAG